MNIKIVTGANQIEAIENLISCVRPEEESFIVVPDRTTLQIEELLFDGLQISSTFNINVVGLTNLALKYVGVELESLTEIESVLFVKKAIENCKGKLKYFKSTNINFCKEVYKLISQFKSSALMPHEIVSRGGSASLKNKVDDMRVIFEEFELLTADRADPSELIDKFADVVKSEGIFRDSTFYFTGFDSFTAKHYALLMVLAKNCRSVVVSLPQPLSQANAYIYEDDIFKKLKKLAASEKIEVEVLSPPCRLKGGALAIASNLFASRLQPQTEGAVRIFEGKTKKDECEFVAKVIAYEVYNGARYRDFAVAASDLKGYAQELKFAFEKNGIPYYSDESENAAKSYLALVFLKILTLSYKNFRKNDLLFLASSPLFNLTREEISLLNTHYLGGAKAFYSLKILPELRALVDSVNENAAKGARAIIAFLEERTQLIESLGLDDKTLSIERQVPEILKQIVSACESVVSPSSFSEFLSAVQIGLETQPLSAIPSYYDQVYIGDATDSFFGKPKKLFVLGASAGALPKTISDNSIFSDDDFERASFSKKVEPSVKLINRRARFKLFSLLSSWTKRLYLSYPLVGEDDKPLSRSLVATQIIELFNKEGSILHSLLPETVSQTQQLLLAMGRSKVGAEEALSISSDLQIRALIKDVLSFDEKKFIRKNRLTDAASLGIGKTLKPTEIEKFYDCPFKVLCENVLKLKELKRDALSPLERGSIIHIVLEEYGKKFAYAPLEEDELKKFISASLKRNFDFSTLEDGDFERYKLEKQLTNLCRLVSKEQELSDYRPWLLEIKVDALVSGKPFTGRVDRVDKAGEVFRVIDYKTGKITTNLVRDMSFGKKLQLFAYAKYIAGKTGLRCGGIYYFDAKCSFKNLSSSPLVGLTTESGKDLAAGAKHISDEEFNLLTDRAERLMLTASQYMQEGRFEPYPDAKSCEYCPYKGVCLYDKERGIRLLKGGER